MRRTWCVYVDQAILVFLINAKNVVLVSIQLLLIHLRTENSSLRIFGYLGIFVHFKCISINISRVSSVKHQIITSKNLRGVKLWYTWGQVGLRLIPASYLGFTNPFYQTKKVLSVWAKLPSYPTYFNLTLENSTMSYGTIGTKYKLCYLTYVSSKSLSVCQNKLHS